MTPRKQKRAPIPVPQPGYAWGILRVEDEADDSFREVVTLSVTGVPRQVEGVELGPLWPRLDFSDWQIDPVVTVVDGVLEAAAGEVW